MAGFWFWFVAGPPAGAMFCGVVCLLANLPGVLFLCIFGGLLRAARNAPLEVLFGC
jgi:hypothetical protein